MAEIGRFEGNETLTNTAERGVNGATVRNDLG